MARDDTHKHNMDHETSLSSEAQGGAQSGQINIQRRDNWNVGKVLSKNCDRQTNIQRDKYFIITHI